MDLREYKGKTIAVGLSGGVDSSTTIALLKEAGAKPFGLTMKIFRPGSIAVPAIGDACYGPKEFEDIKECEALCKSLDVPYICIDLAEEYEKRILDYFKAEYKKGRTPNPCIKCNQEMKFGFMLQKARQSGHSFDYFATGHYVRLEKRNGILMIRRGVYDAKDQSYFLHRLTPETLSCVVFPLGGMTKDEVRNEAKRLKLPMANKAESQDFVPGGYGTLFDDDKPGDIVDEKGNILGRHRGITHYTIGQRRGIGMSLGLEPHYVLALNAEKNQVIVSKNEALFCSAINGIDTIVHDKTLDGTSFNGFVRIRQNHKPAEAKITIDGQNARIDFVNPQRAAAPGQSAVFYDKDGFTLGGTVIDSAERPHT